MGHIWIVLSCLALLGLQLCDSSPYKDGAPPEASTGVPWEGTNAMLASIAVLATLVVAFSACVCCYRKKDFSMFTNAPSSNSGSDVPEVFIPIEQQFSPLSIEASSLVDSNERGVHYSVNSPQMIDQREHITQNNNMQEDNNNGPISAHELENIENNNAEVYIISENENRNNLSEAIRTREMAIVRLTASRDSVVQFEPLPPNITPSTPTSPSNVRPTLQNIAGVDQQQIEIVVNDFEDRWHNMKPNTITKVDHVSILPAPTPQAGILSTIETVPDLQEPRTTDLDTIKEKASSMTSSIISDKDALVTENIKSDSLTNLHGSLEDLRGSSRTSDVDIQSQEERNLLSHPSASEPVSEILYVSPNKLLLRDIQNVDPWLKDVVADAQDDVSYYQDVSDAIKNLDNILNSEKTSSSGSSHQASPSKDVVNLNGETEIKVSGLVKSPGISNFQSITEVFPEIEGDNVKQLNERKPLLHSDDSATGLDVLVHKEVKKEHGCDSTVSELIYETEACSVASKCLLECSSPESAIGERNLADNSSSVQISSNKSTETASISTSALSSECVESDIIRDNAIPSLHDLCMKVKCSLDNVETLVGSNDCIVKVVSENTEVCVSSQISQSKNSEVRDMVKCVPNEEEKPELEGNNTTSSLVLELDLNASTESTENYIGDISNLHSNKELKSDQNILSVTPDLLAQSEYIVRSDTSESEQYRSTKYDTSDEKRLFIRSGSSEYMEIESPLRPSLVNTLEKLMNESSFTCNECGKNITNLSYQDISSMTQYNMIPAQESHPNSSPTSPRKVPKIMFSSSLNNNDMANNLHRNDEKLSTSTPRSNDNDASPAKSAGPLVVVQNEILRNDMLSISSIKANSVGDKINLTDNKISLGKPLYCKDCLTNVGKSVLASNEDSAENLSSVTIGPFENCTLDLYTGLKTHLPGEDVRFENEGIPEEERLVFSSTFNDIVESCEEEISAENTSSHRQPSPTTNNDQTIDFSLETWDKFLGNSLEEVSEDNNFDTIFNDQTMERKSLDQKEPVSAVDDNANLCVAGPSSDNAERLQLRANAEAESRRRRQLMNFNSDITTKLAIAENENNLNIEYSGPVLVEESIVNDLGDYSTDSNEELITEMLKVHLETPNENSREPSLHDSDLNKHIVISDESEDTLNNDLTEVIESEEEMPEAELESLKALRDELELKLPIAQASRPALEDIVVVQELEPFEAVDISSQGPEVACSSGAGPSSARDEMLISYQVPLSPIVEETCSEVSAYENDKIWCCSQHTDSSETYPEADYNSTDEICDAVTLGSERSARSSTESAANRTKSSSDMDKTYVIKDTDTQPISTEMTMSADSLNANEEEDATLEDSPVHSNNVSLLRDELTHTLHDQHEHLTHTICSDKSGNANASSLSADHQQLSQVSEPSAFDNALINDDTQENALPSRKVDLNLKLYSPLSEVSKPSFVSEIPSSKVKTSKAQSMNSWCSNDTLFNVEEDFEDFNCTLNTTPTPGDFTRDVNSANDVHSNIPQHYSKSISPDSISDNRTYTNKTSVPHSISTCTAEAYIQSHILDKRPSIELMRHSPCPDSIIEAAIPYLVDTTNELENVLENSKVSLQMTKLDSVDLECLDKSESEVNISISKSDNDRMSFGTTSPSTHHKVGCSATSTPMVPGFDFENEHEIYETEKKLTNDEDDNLNFTESFIDMQFDFLDRDDSDKPNEHIFTSKIKPDNDSISHDGQSELSTDTLQYLQFEHSVDQRQEGSEERQNPNVFQIEHNIGSFQTSLSPIIDMEIATDSVSIENEVDSNTDNSLLRSGEDVSQYARFERSAVAKPQDLSMSAVAINLGPEVRSIVNCDAQDASLQFSNDTTLYTHFEHSATEKPQDLSILPEVSPTDNSDNSQNEHLNGISTESLKSSPEATSEAITPQNSFDNSLFRKFENSALQKPQELSTTNNYSPDSFMSESLSNKHTIVCQTNEAGKGSEESSIDVSQYSNFERSAADKPQDEKTPGKSDQEKLLQPKNISPVHNEISPIVKIDDQSKNMSLSVHSPSESSSPRLTDLSQLFINFERSAAEKPQDLSRFCKEMKDNSDSTDCSTKTENNSSHETSLIKSDLSHIKEDTTNSSNPSIDNSALVKEQEMSIMCKEATHHFDANDFSDENKENGKTLVTSINDNSQYGNFESSVLERPQDIPVAVSSENLNIVPLSNSIRNETEKEDSVQKELPVCNIDEIVLRQHNGDYLSLSNSLSQTDEQNLVDKSEIEESKDSSQNSSNEVSLYSNFEHSASNKPQDLSNLSLETIDIIEGQNVDAQPNITNTSCNLSHIEKPEDAPSFTISYTDKDIQNVNSIDVLDIHSILIPLEFESTLCSDNDMSQYSNFKKSALKKSQDLCEVSQNNASLDISSSVPNEIDDAKNYKTVSPIQVVEYSSQIDHITPYENKSVEETPEYANFDRLVKDKPQDLSAFTDIENSEGNASTSPTHTPLKNSEEIRQSQNEQSDFGSDQQPHMSPSLGQVEVVQSQSPNHVFSPADIRFTGPASDDIMSTSFNQEPESKGADEAYSCNMAPEALKEWDSESDDSHNSSSSGEFIWKQRQAATCGSAELTTIEEECRSISSSSCSDDEHSDEEVEFVPSSWDCKAEPTKSSLRNLDANLADKKKVVFKRQKYHCVYEYPREVTESEGDPMHSPFLPDYSTYSDWELMGLQDPCRANYDQLVSDFPMDHLYQLLDTSSLSNMATPDEDFFISSSTRPFESLGIMPTSSQFFPGRPAGFKDMDVNITPDELINGEIVEEVADPAYEVVSKSTVDHDSEVNQHPKLNSVDFITPDSGMEDVTPGSALDYDINTENPDTKTNSVATPVIPYWDKQINRNRHFGTLMLPTQGTSSSESQTPTSPLTSSSSESPLSPQTLGGLRHTRDKLKLDLPPSPLNMHSPSILSGRYSNKDLKVFDFRNIDFNNLSKRDLVEKSIELRNKEDTPSDAECEYDHENLSDNATNSSEDAIDNHSVSSSDLPLNNENVITDIMVPTPTFSTFGKQKVKKENSPDKFILMEDKCTEDIVQKADSETTDSCLSQQSSPQSSHSELLQKSVLPIQEGKLDNKPSIEPVKGEGTLLDSGDEDSGIESSARTTLERNIEVAKV